MAFCWKDDCYKCFEKWFSCCHCRGSETWKNQHWDDKKFKIAEWWVQKSWSRQWIFFSEPFSITWPNVLASSLQIRAVFSQLPTIRQIGVTECRATSNHPVLNVHVSKSFKEWITIASITWYNTINTFMIQWDVNNWPVFCSLATYEVD